MHTAKRAVRIGGLLCIMGSVALWSCAGNQTSDRSLVFVDPPDALRLTDNPRTLLGKQLSVAWVDPRPESRFREGYIQGAINLPFQRVSEDHSLLRGYDVLIVYGDDYGDPLADAMSKRLIELGHKDVRTLRGGIRAWTQDGHSLETPDEEATERLSD